MANEVQKNMANEVQVSLRIPMITAEDATKVAELMKTQPEFAGFRVTRASVLRQAMIVGLAEMQKKNRGRRKR